VGSQFGSGESNLKTLEDSLGPWRGNHVKNHTWGTFTILVLRIMYQNSPSLNIVWLTAAWPGSQTSNSNNSTSLKQKTKIF
jgi:hypothetical protein